MIEHDALGKLPYGDAFLFIKRIIDTDYHRAIVTEMVFDEALPFFEAHFKGGPHIVPGVLLIEQVCQSMQLLGVLSAAECGGGERPMGVTGRVQATFPSQARAPCIVRASVEVDRVFDTSIAYRGVAQVDGRDVCRASVIGAQLPVEVSVT